MAHVLRRTSISLGKLVLSSKIRIIGSNTGLFRYKHTGQGFPTHVQNRGKKQQEFSEVKKTNDNDEEGEESSELLQSLKDLEYESIVNVALHVSNNEIEQEIFVIQPYIKWGPKKGKVKPEHQLSEAEALVRSVPHWNVAKSIKVGLTTMDKKAVFGPGQIEQFKKTIKSSRNTDNEITAVFVSKGTLSRQQKLFLEMELGVPVLDRYSVVIQILRLHAISAESKLQVAMAEIPYIWTQMADLDGPNKGQVFYTDAQKDLLKARERRIKNELARIRSQRVLMRRKRVVKNFPIVAVVGYTNAGKTSLIKALTNEQSLVPKDQLFATLDVTAHAGLLPCRLKVLFMDTVGFMSDIPTNLIECFVATLEDAMLADVILHVQDISHENAVEQKNHVETTLEQLLRSISKESGDNSHLPPIINVGNKADLYKGDFGSLDKDIQIVSSKTLSGINDLLETVENAILTTTNRRKMIIKVRCGGEEASWLYKNTAVTESKADPKSSEHILMHVVISDATLDQFKYKFINNTSSQK